MLIIETKYNSFEEYLSKLSKAARKNYKYAMKHNANLVYKKTDFSRVREFMELWTKQLVRGKHPEWAFPIQTVENWYLKGELMVFESNVSLQFIQKRDGYWECHPPLYSKERDSEHYIGKWMWFNLIKYAIENKLNPLNLGGGIDTSWREMIRHREEFPNPKYKWTYVPEETKLHPELQRDYKIVDFRLI